MAGDDVGRRGSASFCHPNRGNGENGENGAVLRGCLDESGVSQDSRSPGVNRSSTLKVCIESESKGFIDCVTGVFKLG